MVFRPVKMRDGVVSTARSFRVFARPTTVFLLLSQGKITAKSHLSHMRDAGYNVRHLGRRSFCVSLDETVTADDVDALVSGNSDSPCAV